MEQYAAAVAADPAGQSRPSHGSSRRSNISTVNNPSVNKFLNRSASLGESFEFYPGKLNTWCKREPSYILSILLIVFSVCSFLVALVSVLYFLLGTAVQADVCRYIQPDDNNNNNSNKPNPALKVADVLTNTFLAVHWQSWTKVWSSGMTQVNFTLPMPKNALNAVIHQCSTDAGHPPMGLFEALSMKTFFNATNISASPWFKNYTKMAEPILHEFIQKMPNTSFNYTLVNTFYDYFKVFDRWRQDNQNSLKVNEYIKNSSEHWMSVSNFNPEEFKPFALAAKGTTPKENIMVKVYTGYIQELISVWNNYGAWLEDIKAYNDKIKTLQNYITITGKNFSDTVNWLKQNGTLFIQPSQKIDPLVHPVFKSRRNMMETLFLSGVVGSLNQLAGNLLPCRRLPIIVKRLNEGLCQNASLTTQMWALAFYTFLTAVGLQVGLIFSWILVRYSHHLLTKPYVAN